MILGPGHMYLVVDTTEPYLLISAAAPAVVQQELDNIIEEMGIVVPGDVTVDGDDDGNTTYYRDDVIVDPDTLEHVVPAEEDIISRVVGDDIGAIMPLPDPDHPMFSSLEQRGIVHYSDLGMLKYFKNLDESGFYLYFHSERIPYSLLTQQEIEEWKRRPSANYMAKRLAAQVELVKKRKEQEEASMKTYVIKKVMPDARPELVVKKVVTETKGEEMSHTKTELEIKKVPAVPPVTPVDRVPTVLPNQVHKVS